MVEAWLEDHAHGYKTLSEDERKAIRDFTLLWSLYEARALAESGSADKILSAVKNLENGGALDIAPFANQMSYFFQRYYDGSGLTAHYPHLHLRNNDHPTLVEGVLRKQVTDNVSQLSALFIIIYRLRNNLLHGPKWAYGIAGQLDNFRNANAALMTYLERY